MRALHRIDNVVDASHADEVEDVLIRILADLDRIMHIDAMRTEAFGRTVGRIDAITAVEEALGDVERLLLVAVCDRDQHIALHRHLDAAGDERLVQRLLQRHVTAQRFTGTLHLRPQRRIDAAQFGEGEHRCLDKDAILFLLDAIQRVSLLFQGVTQYAHRGDVGHRHAGDLA